MKGRSHGLGGLPGSGGARDSARASVEGDCQFVEPEVVVRFKDSLLMTIQA